MQPDNEPNLSPRAQRGEALNQWLGVIWCRCWALVIGLAAVALLAWYFTVAQNKAFGATLFVTTISVVLLAVSRHLWRNKDGLAEILDGANYVARPARAMPAKRPLSK